MVTVVSKPEEYHTTGNPVVFLLSSTNVSKKGFRYVVQLFAGVNLIANLKLAPRQDGIGETDVSKILSTLVRATNIHNELQAPTALIPANFRAYQARFGEEFIQEWIYTAIASQTTGQYNGFVKLTSTVAHGYVAGSIVENDQVDGGLLYPSLENQLIVLQVNSATEIVINVLFVSLNYSTFVSGKTIFADNRKTTFVNLVAYNFFAIYGAHAYKNWQKNNYLKYDFFFENGGNIDCKIWASLKPISQMRCDGGRYLFSVISKVGLIAQVTNMITQNGVRFTIASNNSAKIMSQFVLDVTNIDAQIAEFGTGYVQGAPPFNDNRKAKIQLIILEASTGNQLSQTYEFDYDPKCRTSDARIHFVDRLGSWAFFPFSLNVSKNLQIEKKTVGTQVGRVLNDPLNSTFGYDATESTEKTISVNVSEKFTLFTDELTLEMMPYFEEMLTSPETFFECDLLGITNEPCSIEDKSAKIETPTQKKIFAKTLQIELINKNYISC